MTITFGDQAENHVGMQKIGNPVTTGFTLEELYAAQRWFWSCGVDCTVYNIGLGCLQPEDRTKATPAYILVAHQGLDAILGVQDGASDFYREHVPLEKDTKAKMYGKVCNKTARWNLCFGDQAQEPNYEQGQGRIVAFSQMPLLNMVRERLPEIVGDKACNLVAEANYYYDPSKCGIGFHGDAERKVVIGIRVGQPMPFQFQWYNNHKPVGERAHLILGHGDVYMFSDKAVGHDWRCSSFLTLRHAAGAPKYLK